jgi:AAA ATPase domain
VVTLRESRASSRGASGARPFFAGRKAERVRLIRAISDRESVLITGPRGMGKTALVLQVLESLTESLRIHCIYLSGAQSLRNLLEGLLSRLFERRDPALLAAASRRNMDAASFRRWLTRQTSSRLKGVLYGTAAAGDYRIFLDHSTPVTGEAGKVIKELALMRNTPVFLMGREPAEFRGMENLYWSKRQVLAVPPLSRAAAGELLERSIGEYGLAGLAAGNFREEVLRLSGSVPGAIRGMCALAAEPGHCFGSKIKTRSLYVDYVTRGSSAASAGSLKSRSFPQPNRSADA